MSMRGQAAGGVAMSPGLQNLGMTAIFHGAELWRREEEQRAQVQLQDLQTSERKVAAKMKRLGSKEGASAPGELQSAVDRAKASSNNVSHRIRLPGDAEHHGWAYVATASPDVCRPRTFFWRCTQPTLSPIQA